MNTTSSISTLLDQFDEALLPPCDNLTLPSYMADDDETRQSVPADHAAPTPGPSNGAPSTAAYVWPSKLEIDTQDDYFEYAFDFVYGEDWEERDGDTAEDADEDGLQEDTDIEEPYRTLSSPSRAHTPETHSLSSSSTRSGSSEPESDDLPTRQAASHSSVLVTSDHWSNPSMPVPGQGRPSLRSSARIREKRKRVAESEDEKENVPEGEPSEAANDTTSNSPAPVHSRPTKRPKIQQDDSEDSEDSSASESDEESEDDSADEGGPTPGSSNSVQECRLGGCKHKVSGIYKKDWAHTKVKGHIKRNTDDLVHLAGLHKVLSQGGYTEATYEDAHGLGGVNEEAAMTSAVVDVTSSTLDQSALNLSGPQPGL
ncbi:hypothetical protein TRAPUB_2749 [Trametes pubescens]|uniref:Uncharacterized protein n=1 Tax=Trametes pubescens TaxID=154538 RepID=A0A1M2VFV3_TRAPU|nr:hypothetical protein TRAPUB_2749 [Trametes pubescens]